MAMKASIVAVAFLAAAGSAQPLQPTKNDVKEAIAAQSYASYAVEELASWRHDLQEALKRKIPDEAADAVAAKYGFAAADMRRLVRAWIIAQSRRYEDDQKWVPGVRAEFHALAPRMGSKPLGLAILAEALDATTEDCPADDFNALLQGARDPAVAGYVIATASSCTGNFARAALAGGDRAMPALIRVAEYGGLPPRDALPLYAWLTSPPALAHVRESDRTALSAMLWQRYLTALLAAGLDGRALASFDSLPADLRAAVVSPDPRPRLAAVVDGIAMTFTGEAKAESAVVLADEADGLASEASKAKPRDLSSIGAPILRLAEAMAMAGREDEARRLLKTLPGLAEAKAAAACQYDSRTDCAETMRLPMGALPLDHLLNTPDSDPYPIAETTLAGSHLIGPSASDSILCRVFPKDDYPQLCADGADNSYFSETDTDPKELAAAEAAFEQLIPDFKTLRSSILGPRDVPAPAQAERFRRATVAATPPDFAEKVIPAAYAGAAAPAALKGLAPLPKGFEPVRVERDVRRVVAISVSQTYDPTGEVSQGGYWVHVSDDGGKHWERPLYTGLADRFPYVVAPASRLPLIAGETLQLAVEVAEIDTASISYPPVALRTRRRARNLYLTIPLAALRRDSDDDGLTDIAAHHLLLDRPRSAASTPFVLGSDYDADCRAAPSAEKRALIDLLGRLAGPSGAAIVEPVDRPAGKLIVGWRGAAAAGDQPAFLIGRPQDYACLASRRLIIVYDKADIELIRRFTPDFHALEMPRIVFNRARDRGYVAWSMGWAGGTYRLRRVDGKWQFDSISSWIT
jgi:hypothetical protein